MTYRVGIPTEADAIAIVPMLRDASRAELLAIGADDFPETVTRLATGSAHSYCGADDAGPLFIGGAVPVDATTAIVWMLLTDRVDQHRMFALREMRRQAVGMSRRWAVLRNYTDDKHPRTVDWLQWLGFDVGELAPHPRTGQMMRLFERRVDHV